MITPETICPSPPSAALGPLAVASNIAAKLEGSLGGAAVIWVWVMDRTSGSGLWWGAVRVTRARTGRPLLGGPLGDASRSARAAPRQTQTDGLFGQIFAYGRSEGPRYGLSGTICGVLEGNVIEQHGHAQVLITG